MMLLRVLLFFAIDREDDGNHEVCFDASFDEQRSIMSQQSKSTDHLD